MDLVLCVAGLDGHHDLAELGERLAEDADVRVVIFTGAGRAFSAGGDMHTTGAGLPEHLHVHIVPRWDGDTNFMSVCSGTDVISQSLTELFEQLKQISKEHNLPCL